MSDPDTPRNIGAVRVTRRGPVSDLYFPPLRAAGSALMLAFFGVACSVIGLAAISGLARSSDAEAANMLALAFAGVFALPLFALGQLFIMIALWTAANSLTVEISHAGLRTVRRCFGLLLGRHTMPREEITALDARLAAKYVGVFGAARYYHLVARSRNRTLLIADSLKGPDVTENVRNMIIEQLGMPELVAASNKVPAADGR